jgi:hypothetical protein
VENGGRIIEVKKTAGLGRRFLTLFRVLLKFYLPFKSVSGIIPHDFGLFLKFFPTGGKGGECNI